MTLWRSASQVVAVVAAAGFIAGLLGIGGALIFNPFLLQLGVHPQVSWVLPSSALVLTSRHGEKAWNGIWSVSKQGSAIITYRSMTGIRCKPVSAYPNLRIVPPSVIVPSARVSSVRRFFNEAKAQLIHQHGRRWWPARQS